MVTVQEARQQIVQQRQSLQQQQQQIQEARTQIEQTKLRALTRAQLQVRGREEIIKRKLQKQELEGLKKAQLSQLDPLETEIKQAGTDVDKFEQQVKSVEAQIAEAKAREKAFEEAKKLFKKDIVDPGASPQTKKFLREIRAGEEIALTKAVREASAKIEALGLKPIPVIEDGKVVAIKGEQVIQQVKEIVPILEKGRFPKAITLPSELPIGQRAKVPLDIKIEKRIGEVAYKIKRVFNVQSEIQATKGFKEFTEKFTNLITIPEKVSKEQKVMFIELPSVVKGTKQVRPVDFTDINTGRLPPRQNLELITNKIIFDFNQGRLSETKALKQLETAQKKFIDDESIRTAGLRFAEGAGLAALTIVAPPAGFTAIGLLGAEAIIKRREVLQFAKTNPKAAVTQFVAFAAGGFALGGGVAASKRIKAAKVETPTLEITGKARTKFEEQVIENLDKDIRVEMSPIIKNTATRTFLIDIPSPKNKVTLKIVEFTKDNQKRFIGLEFIDGKLKPKQIITGLSITKGARGRTDIITRSIRTNTRFGLSNIEVSEFLERAILKSQRRIGLRSTALTQSEVKLAKQFKLRGLFPNQIREILRRPLFGIAEAQRKANKPFSKSEFQKANKLSKSQVLLSERIVKVRLTNLRKQLEPLIGERNKLDVRVEETGRGVSFVFGLPPPTRIGVKPKKGVVKVPADVRGLTSIKIKKIKPTRKTPLERTFTEQSQQISQILKSKKSPSVKIKQLTSLEKKISPTGTFRAIARKIQLERIKLAKRQALGKAIITSTGVALKTKPQLVQKIKTLSKSKTKISLAQVTPSLVTEAEKLSLAGKISVRQLQSLKLRLATKTGVPPKQPTPKITEVIKPIVPIITTAEKEVVDTRLIKAVQKLGKKGVDIIVGQRIGRQKTIGKNLPKWKALKKAQRFVDSNIEGSYLLKPSKKKAKGKDIKPFNPSFKFRSSKANALFVVERRKHRLDHSQEVKQLNLFKGKVPKRFLPKIKKKRKKK